MLVYRIESKNNNSIYQYTDSYKFVAYHHPTPDEDFMFREPIPNMGDYIFGFESMAALKIWWDKDMDSLRDYGARLVIYDVEDCLTDVDTASIICGAHQLAFYQPYGQIISNEEI